MMSGARKLFDSTQMKNKENMATVVGFISEKGGVGKTTACYHVAVALNRFYDRRVLVIDANYQRGGITGRFFPQLIESFGRGVVPGTTLFHKFQQLYSDTSDCGHRRNAVAPWSRFDHGRPETCYGFD